MLFLKIIYKYTPIKIYLMKVKGFWNFPINFEKRSLSVIFMPPFSS